MSSLTGMSHSSSSSGAVGQAALNHLDVSRRLPLTQQPTTSPAPQPQRTQARELVESLQRHVQRDLLKPYLRSQWTAMSDNLLSFAGIRLRLDLLLQRCRGLQSHSQSVRRCLTEVAKHQLESDIAELEWFQQLFASLDNVAREHKLLESYDIQSQSQSQISKASSVRRIPALQLRPEYELYHRFAGKPLRSRGYDEGRLAKLRAILASESMTSASVLTPQQRLAACQRAVEEEHSN